LITPQIHPDYVRSAKLGQEITELCGYLYAATYRLLVMIREFDQDGLWKASTLAPTGSTGNAASA
jgi:hypothetical protein